jgi:cytochrome c oxidase cbb3-type subunit 4
MYAEILQRIEGIEVFPVISLVLFVIVFSGMLIQVCRVDRSRLDRMAALPLDDSRAGPDRPSGH